MKVIKAIYQALALKVVVDFFDNDNHEIVSKRGWEILNDSRFSGDIAIRELQIKNKHTWKK